jgi:segregation and condensation protein B
VASADRESAGEPDDDEQLDEAGLSDDDDDFDPAFEGGLPPLPGETSEPVTVDDPADESQGPTDVRVGPDLPVPASIEQALEVEDDEEAGRPVDAPLPPDGDDAGDVFDQAADDDVSDDSEVDLPFTEEDPGLDEDSGDEQAEGEDAAGEPADGEDAGDGQADGEDTEDEQAEAEDAGDGQERRDESGAGYAGAIGAAIPAQGGPGREPAAASGDQNARTDDDVDLESPELDDAELRGALESILLVVDEPVGEMQLAQILEQPTERVGAMLEDISARYTAAGHGFDLRRAAGGWRLYTRPEYATYVERFVLDGQSVRLTQAALETLAVVAYKQPVTRSRISAIRGVNCDGVMRTLATRGLIEECGTEPETGAHLYRTTALFLEKLGLNSVDQLPPLAPFLPDDVEEVLDASG